MSGSYELNLIAMDIEKNIVFTVQGDTTLAQVSEELCKLYKDSDKDSFVYRSSEDEKELPHQKDTMVSKLASTGDNQVILYVSCRPKKGEACCQIY